MKHIIILIILFFSCQVPIENKNYKILDIDSCEYIQFNNNYTIHKQNCIHCNKRKYLDIVEWIKYKEKLVESGEYTK